MVPNPTQIFPSCYAIQVAGRIAAERADWFDSLTLAAEATPDGTMITLLSGTLADQAALFGVLNRIRDLGLKLISVSVIAPSSNVPGYPQLNQEAS